MARSWNGSRRRELQWREHSGLLSLEVETVMNGGVEKKTATGSIILLDSRRGQQL